MPTFTQPDSPGALPGRRGHCWPSHRRYDANCSIAGCEVSGEIRGVRESSERLRRPRCDDWVCLRKGDLWEYQVGSKPSSTVRCSISCASLAVTVGQVYAWTATASSSVQPQAACANDDVLSY